MYHFYKTKIFQAVFLLFIEEVPITKKKQQFQIIIKKIINNNNKLSMFAI